MHTPSKSGTSLLHLYFWSEFAGWPPFCILNMRNDTIHVQISRRMALPQGHICSLVRYRNFRTFTSPSPVQFSSLAVDPSGELEAAGSTDSFEVFLWSVQTGKLLGVLTGH
jgi:WD40 repeat protein